MNTSSRHPAWGLSLGVALAVLVLLVGGCGPRHTALRSAFYSKDYARFEALVRAEPHPDFLIDVALDSPLMLAVESGSPDLVLAFLAMGASANFQAADGSTAMTKACAEANPDVVRILIAAGGDLRHRSRSGDCIEKLHGWRGSRREVDTLRVLASSGVDVVKEAKERKIGKTPLLHYLLAEGKTDVLVAYLELGASAGVVDERGRSLLVGAVARGDYGLLRALLDAEADPRVKDHRGEDVMTSARSWGRRHPRAPSTKTLVVTDAAFDPKLTTPEERVAALDAVMPDLKQRVAAIEAAAREERRVEAEKYMRELRDQPAPVQQPKAATTPRASYKPEICRRPDIAACIAQGRDCQSCWISASTDRSKPEHWAIDLAKSRDSSGGDKTQCRRGTTPCAGYCCGNGMKCCRAEGGGGGVCIVATYSSGNPRSCPWGYE